MNALKAIIDDPKHHAHVHVVCTTLSRLGLVEKAAPIDVNVSGEVRVSHTDQALNDLKALLALGVAREKLEEMFGHSGLGRYERMLAEREGRARPVPALIDSEVIEGDAVEVRDE